MFSHPWVVEQLGSHNDQESVVVVCACRADIISLCQWLLYLASFLLNVPQRDIAKPGFSYRVRVQDGKACLTSYAMMNRKFYTDCALVDAPIIFRNLIFRKSSNPK